MALDKKTRKRIEEAISAPSSAPAPLGNVHIAITSFKPRAKGVSGVAKGLPTGAQGYVEAINNATKRKIANTPVFVNDPMFDAYGVPVGGQFDDQKKARRFANGYRANQNSGKSKRRVA